MVGLVAILWRVCCYVLKEDVFFGCRGYQFCIITVKAIR